MGSADLSIGDLALNDQLRVTLNIGGYKCDVLQRRFGVRDLPPEDQRQRIPIKNIVELLDPRFRRRWTTYFRKHNITTLGQMLSNINGLYFSFKEPMIDDLAEKIDGQLLITIHRILSPTVNAM